MWIGRALCRSGDPDAWFAEDLEGVAAAKLMCGACPVRSECLSWALSSGAEFGVWGGTTPEERRAMARAGVAA